jgi:thiol-disulfide isomerase/thioredoxin
MLEEIDDANFRETTSSGEGPVLVLFYKDPCPFCKGMKAAVEKFAKKHLELRTVQIDGEKNPKAAGEMGVERFPDLFFFKNGEQRGRFKGLGNPKELEKVYGQV